MSHTAEDQTSPPHLAQDTLLLGRRQIRYVRGDGASQDLHKVPALHAIEGLGADPRQQHTHLADIVERQHLGEDRPAGGEALLWPFTLWALTSPIACWVSGWTPGATL